MSFDPLKPYNDLPLLPPTADIETRAILKACIEARAAITELRVSGELIPNQAILINSIPLLEAQASSEIENVVTTTDRLFRYASLKDRNADPATKEAARYRTALNEGFKLLEYKPFSAGIAVEICRTITGIDLDIRRTPGTKLTNDRTGQTIYTPPEGEALIREKLANLEKYVHEATEVDPLIRLAVMHYQFEAIHPFEDGNGRTGRILNILYLIDQKLLAIPVLYLSRHIIRNKPAYYQLLLEVTTYGRWEPWVLYMLEALTETARFTTAKINDIRTLTAETADVIRQNEPKIYSRELAELIFIQPYCRITNVIEAGIARRDAASNYLRRLVEIGVLSEMKVGREKLFVNPRLLRLLTQASSK